MEVHSSSCSTLIAKKTWAILQQKQNLPTATSKIYFQGKLHKYTKAFWSKKLQKKHTRAKEQSWVQVLSALISSTHNTPPRRTGISTPNSCLLVTYWCMASAFIPVCSQPLQGPFHFKLHILSGEGVPSHRQVSHGFRGHLHHHRVTGGEQVAQVVGKAADPGGIASFNANQTHWNKLVILHIHRLYSYA